MRKFTANGVEYKGFDSAKNLRDEEALLLMVSVPTNCEPFMLFSLDSLDAINEVASFLKNSYGIELREDMYDILR